MLKSKIILLSTLALLSLSFAVQADTHDTVQVKTWDVSAAVHDVMPTLRASDFSEPAATVATYAIPEADGITSNTRVFRDFRTIADSGGRV
jgi:hypothetical protein